MYGERIFVGKDVAQALGYVNPNKAMIDHVDDEDKQMSRFATGGQQYNMVVINESGLYSLILSSKLDSARRFKRWVTSEVLPEHPPAPLTRGELFDVILSNAKNLITSTTMYTRFFGQSPQQLVFVAKPL